MLLLLFIMFIWLHASVANIWICFWFRC